MAPPLLLSTHDICWRHDTGYGHPERADRLTVVRDRLLRPDLAEGVAWVEAPEVSSEQILAVHPSHFSEQLSRLSEMGGGSIDPDTVVSSDSFEAARRAAGAGLDLIDRLDRGEAEVGWSIVRPPGHHATANRQMGFCLYNNVAIAAAALRDRGERVAIVDIDAHHGNGTQDIFYEDPNVLFVSYHQFPFYPGTGAPTEVGEGAGRGTTVNLAMPAGATGDTYRRATDDVVLPRLERFAPTWLLISAGFDGHRADPLTELGLSSGDFADILADLMPVVPAGRRLLFLEGGYDLQALSDSAGAVAGMLLEERIRPEAPTSGGPEAEFVELARVIHVERGVEPVL